MPGPSGREGVVPGDPDLRFVITLSGTLQFQTKSGAAFTIRPSDVLLAQDNSGTGHKWGPVPIARSSSTWT